MVALYQSSTMSMERIDVSLTYRQSNGAKDCMSNILIIFPCYGQKLQYLLLDNNRMDIVAARCVLKDVVVVLIDDHSRKCRRSKKYVLLDKSIVISPFVVKNCTNYQSPRAM